MGIDRLRELGIHEIDCVCVISEESMIPLCEKYGVKWCMHQNLPLGRKKNYGLTHAMCFDFEYLIELGSDDILKDEFLEAYSHSWFKYHVISLQEMVMLNSENGECRKWTTGGIGVGRAISRIALESVKEFDGYKLWSDGINRGLDNDSTFRLARNGFLEKRVSLPEPVAIDIKSEVNIHQYDFTPGGVPYDYTKAISGLSYAELCALKDMQRVTV